MKKLLYLFMFVPCVLFAQNPKLSSPDQYRMFKHMEVGTAIGSTGIGVEFSTPINQHLNLRAGFSIMPTIKNNQAYAMTTVSTSDKEISQAEKERRITHLCQDYLGPMVGTDVDEAVDMTRQIGYYNGKILIDWHPFHNKKWYFTAGAYIGSKNVGKIFNTQEESATMLAINNYNTMYDQVIQLDKYEYPTFTWGKFSFETDPENGKYIKGVFRAYGRIGIRVGDNIDGTPNYLEPNELGIMKAEAKVNTVKPYVGFGYNTNIGYDKRWSIGFNAGAMYWGTPHVIYYKKNNETIDLAHDVKNIKGMVGQYMKLVKALPILPVLEIKLAYTIY